MIYLPPIKEGLRRSGMRCRCDVSFRCFTVATPFYHGTSALLHQPPGGTHRQAWMVVQQEDRRTGGQEAASRRTKQGMQR